MNAGIVQLCTAPLGQTLVQPLNTWTSLVYQLVFKVVAHHTVCVCVRTCVCVCHCSDECVTK